MEAPGGPPRKYYRITETGRATLKAQRIEWKSFITSVEKMLGDTP
jgi:PadR family transcriptional regulator PadR